MQSEPSFLDNLIANLDVSALAESLFRLACGGEDDKHARAVKMVSEPGFFFRNQYRMVIGFFYSSG